MNIESEYDDYQDEDYTDYPDVDDYTENIKITNNDNIEIETSQDVLFQRSNTYYIMDYNRTEKYIEDMIKDLRDTWGVSEGFALTVLKKFAWEKDKAINSLMDGTNFDLMEVIHDPNNKEFECSICYSKEPLTNAYSFGCTHFYCKECFFTYLKLAIDEGQALKSCPTAGCKEVLTPKLCEMHLKSNPEIYNKYKEFFFKNIVDTSVNLVWCPGNKCANIIQLLKMKKGDQLLLNIRCECGHSFCFGCRNVAHRPLHCDKFGKWMTLVGGKDESLNDKWIQQNSKPCPKCRVHIEKNQGCMHMTCRSCKYEFCWLCHGDWKTHGAETGGYYNCNKYKASNETMDEGQKEFEKFNFYRNRFEQHWSALGFAQKKKLTILENFKQINFEVDHMEDDFFLKEALDLIIEARRAITMTYAVGYFSKFNEIEKEIYEMQQSLLWAALDNLDKYTDQLEDIEKMEDLFVNLVQGIKHLTVKFNEFKLNLKGRTAGVIAACNKLLKYIEGELQEKQGSLINVEGSVEEFKFKNVPKSKSEYWNCEQCTYGNHSSQRICEMCNAAQTGQAEEMY